MESCAEKVAAGCGHVALRSRSTASSASADQCEHEDSIRSTRLNEYFGLASEEVFKDSFVCALLYKNSWFLLQGTLYVFEHYVCFASNLFGFETRRIIPLQNITRIAKRRHCGFANSILIESEPSQVDFFTSFLQRRPAFDSIQEGLKAVRPPAWHSPDAHRLGQRAWAQAQGKTRQALKFFCCGNLIRQDSFAALHGQAGAAGLLSEQLTGRQVSPSRLHGAKGVFASGGSSPQQGGSKLQSAEEGGGPPEAGALRRDVGRSESDSDCDSGSDNQDEERDAMLGMQPESDKAAPMVPLGMAAQPLQCPVLSMREGGSPPPITDDMCLMLDLTLRCSPSDLFTHLLSDASTVMQEFHEQQMGHTCVQRVSGWMRPPSSLEGFEGHLRYFQFRYEAKGTLARHPLLCKQVQRVRAFKSQHLLMQVEQTMPELAVAPGLLVGDDLKVETRWDVVPLLDAYDIPLHAGCRLQIHARVVISPTAPWLLRMARSTVRQRTLDEMRESMAKLGPFLEARLQAGGGIGIGERGSEGGSGDWMRIPAGSDTCTLHDQAFHHTPHFQPTLMHCPSAPSAIPDLSLLTTTTTSTATTASRQSSPHSSPTPPHHRHAVSTGSPPSHLTSTPQPGTTPMPPTPLTHATPPSKPPRPGRPGSLQLPSPTPSTPYPPDHPPPGPQGRSTLSHNRGRAGSTPPPGGFPPAYPSPATPKGLTSLLNKHPRVLEYSYLLLVAALLLVTLTFVAVSGTTRNLVSMSLVLPSNIATFAMTIDMTWKDVLLFCTLGVIVFLLIKLWHLQSAISTLTGPGGAAAAAAAAAGTGTGGCGDGKAGGKGGEVAGVGDGHHQLHKAWSTGNYEVHYAAHA